MDFADGDIDARNHRPRCDARATFDGRTLKLAGFVAVLYSQPISYAIVWGPPDRQYGPICTMKENDDDKEG